MVISLIVVGGVDIHCVLLVRNRCTRVGNDAVTRLESDLLLQM